MRGAAAPARFSLSCLPSASALLERTRSRGVNASSQRARCKRGGTHVSRSEWGGVGVASREPESAPLRDVAADSGFVARRRCQTPGLDSALPVTLTPYRGSGSSEPFGPTLAQQSRPSSRAHQAPFAVAFLHGAHGPGRSLLTLDVPPGVRNSYEWVILRQCDQWGVDSVRVRERSNSVLLFFFFFWSSLVVVRRGDMEYGDREVHILDCR